MPFRVVFCTTLSNNRSRAGSTPATMARDSKVPRPSKNPSSLIIGLAEVKARVNPAVARIIAEIRIAAKLLPMAAFMASFRQVFPVAQVSIGKQYGIVYRCAKLHRTYYQIADKIQA